MSTQDIITLLGQPDGPKPTLEELNTYVDDAGHRLPQPLDEGFFDRLPPLITDVLAHYATSPMRTQQLLALLTLMGTVTIHCRVRHDNRYYGTALMTLIFGSPASGKGSITDLLPLVQGIDRKVRADSRRDIRRAERLIEVQRLKRQRMGRSRDMNEADIERAVMGEDDIEVPMPRCHMMADNITVPAMLQYLKGYEPHAPLLAASELLTIVQQAKTDFGNMRDLLLRAFHEEPMSYAIKTGHESIYLEHVRLGVLLSGTYESLRLFMPTVSDGLPSRFLFYETPCNTAWRTAMTPDESAAFNTTLHRTAAVMDSLHSLLTRYDNSHEATPRPTLVLTAMQEEYLERAFSEMNDWYLGYTASEEILSAVRRRIIDAKRIIMLLSLLRAYQRHESWDEALASPHIAADDDDIDTTLMLIDYLMRHSVAAFRLIQPRRPDDDLPEEFTPMLHLDMLPPTFTTAEAIDVGKRGALSESATKRRIRNWTNAKFIRKLERGKYAKCMQKQLRSGVDATN